MLIKICGITREEEIQFLNSLPLDYIGLVFTESKRRISIDRGRQLISRLSKDITPVAVFRNDKLEYIKSVIESLNISVVQLHGNEDISLIKELKKEDSILWKGLCLGEDKEDNYLKYFDRIIYDGAIPGSGQEVDVDNLSLKEPFILSGGLTPLNIEEKLSLENLIGVDVSSGVEVINENGERIKNYEKCKDFVERVRKYERSKGEI